MTPLYFPYMRYFVKKEEVYSRLAFINKFRGIMSFSVALVMVVFSMYIVPQVIDLYQDFQLDVPAKTQYAMYVMLAVAIALSVLGVQSLFSTPNKKEIEAKLAKYKTGEPIPMGQFSDYKFNLFFILFLGVFVSYLVLSIVIPIYELSLNIESGFLNSKDKINTASWSDKQIGQSNFYIKHPVDAVVDDVDGCLRIKYGLAYLNILNPGGSEGGCLQTGMGAYDTRVQISEKIMIDGTEYSFSGSYVNRSKDPYAEGVNYEFYRNEQGIFGNGYKVEHGGYFKPDQLIQYKKDLNVVINMMESIYRP